MPKTRTLTEFLLSLNQEERERPILVGEQPAPQSEWWHPRYRPLTGRSGEFLGRLGEFPPMEYLNAFERRNLFALHVDWDPSTARFMARSLEPYLERRYVIALGKKVQTAFQIPPDAPRFREFTCGVVKAPTDRTFVLLTFPHPSGKCQDWNDPFVMREGSKALRASRHKARVLEEHGNLRTEFRR